eukprot:CAMPEP_0194269444 /NCGR_PEP_ID=MMETSP0169-20130528/3603_1 /TAXON_ID=218684 /ORGANISM="Corethron pennatum, Strain L29A3" /LENGTH=454 /DNA_ID=CAMNT_0039011087 /DNA_START=86 /DNA_END=1450 /DNA_ORIENTATION=+
MKFPLIAFFLPTLTSGFSTARVSCNVVPPSSKARASSSSSLSMSKDSPSEKDFFKFTLKVSDMVYMFADLRKLVSDHEETFNLNLNERQRKRKKIVAFDTPALIDTRFAVDNQFPHAKMRNPVTAAAIKEFLDRNKQFFKQELHGDLEFVYAGNNEDKIWMVDNLEKFDESFDADIVEFDDKFANEIYRKTALVYSVIVNRSSKEIIIVFRGSINRKDWLTNFKFALRTPPVIEEIANKKAKVHRGFSDYLLRKSKTEGNSQLDQILNVLKDVYAYTAPGRDYSDYKLVITGHSLGGSLSQLLSFILAGWKEAEFIPKPVTAVTYASPVVGNNHFFLAYQELEKANKVRHIRVSNKGDVITGTPGLNIIKPYTQTGVNIHLKKNKKAEVKYENTKSILSVVASIFLGKKHSIYGVEGKSYFERLFQKDEKTGAFINDHVLTKTVEDLYDEYAPF